MAQRDPIEEFMRNYGRLYDRLEPRDQEFVRTTLEAEAEMEQLRSRSLGNEPEPSIQEDSRQTRLKAAEAVENGMWEENETVRTAYRFWKPEPDVEAGERPREFPTDYRLDALVPWERGTSTLDEGIQVYEMTGHEWLKEGDIVTTPEGRGYVIMESSSDRDQSKDAPDFSWSGSYSETVDISNLALDRSKDVSGPAQAFTGPEKQEVLKDYGDILDAQGAREASYVARLETEIEAKMWSGKGQADERLILSGGQKADSWAKVMRPEKTTEDFQAALRSMGIEKAAERQAAQDKGIENARENGGEGIER